MTKGVFYNFLFLIIFHDIFQEPKTRQLRDMDTKSFNEFLPEIPLWIKNPDYERVRV